ncbi:MAG: polysaccharide deacetylase family protein [Geobacteraceae bacterium]|nr:polysaccharide deacetylase family protein [Geobacteraceae bacterium]
MDKHRIMTCLAGFFSVTVLLTMTVRDLQAEGIKEKGYSAQKSTLVAEFSEKEPTAWSETVPGVKTSLRTKDRVIALTLDACGSPKGKGIDADLIDFLEREKIPAALFINARWIDANPDLFLKLASNPLFTIANHGFQHRPASVNGRSIYGIDGTKDVGELVDEIELNARKIQQLTGKRPRYYRSGTAYYDEVAVQIAERLGHQVIGFSVLGDAGATYSKEQVATALLSSVPGSIVILHMNHPESGTGKGVMLAVPLLKKKGFRFVSLAEYPLQ